MALGTIAPAPVFTGFDNNGDPLVGGKLYVYLAGTATPAVTYTDADLLVPNTNPIILDSAGRATIFLGAGSYKFVQNTSADALVWSQDNIAQIPRLAAPTNAAIEVAGTAGESVTAGAVVYLSSGLGGKTAGRWYLADATNAYSSSEAEVVGFAVVDTLAGVTGLFRVQGVTTVTGPLVTGTKYYISTTPGVLTATDPILYSRLTGIANTTTSLLASITLGPLNNIIAKSFHATTTGTGLLIDGLATIAGRVDLTAATNALVTNGGGATGNGITLSGNTLTIGAFSAASSKIEFVGATLLTWHKIQYTESGNTLYIGTNAGTGGLTFSNVGAASFSKTLTAAENVGLAATKKLYLDGVAMTGDTYIVESAANTLDLVSGGVTVSLASGVMTLGGTGDLRFLLANGLGGRIYRDATAGDLTFFSQANNVFSSGNVNIGGTVARATTAPTKALQIFDGTAPVGTLANGVTLYSVAGKLWAMDAAGTATKLTP